MAFTSVPNDADTQARSNLRNAAKTFSKEELDHLRGLPVRKVKYAGQQIAALYDEEQCKLYILDDKGVPTGEIKSLSKPLSALSSNKSSQPSPETNDDSTKKKSPFSLGKKEKPPKKDVADSSGSSGGGFFKKNKVAVIALIVVACIGLLFGVKALIGIIGFSGSSREPSAPIDEQTTVSVIQAVQNILPDTKLTPDMFTEVSISSASFNEVLLTSGRSVYEWKQIPFIDGMESSQFIPAGSYLYTDCVLHEFYYDDNPFCINSDEEMDFLAIPANIAYSDLTKVYIGEIVDIEISRDTVSGRQQKIQTEVVEGLEHSSAITKSVTTDVFSFEDITICDLINSNGESMYDILSRYNSVPDGNLQSVITDDLRPRFEDNLAIGNNDVVNIFPEFYVTSVVIKIPKEHIKAIGKLSGDTTSLSISNVGNNAETNAKDKKAFVEESSYTCQVIAEVLKSFR